jgi:hypothetical protein
LVSGVGWLVSYTKFVNISEKLYAVSAKSSP